MKKHLPRTISLVLFLIISLFLLSGCNIRGAETGFTEKDFQTDKEFIQLNDLKLIPWKIPEGVFEPIRVLKIRVEKPSKDRYIFKGKVVNIGKKTAFGADVVLQFYDANKKGIYSVAELADPYKLEPDKMADFVIRYDIDEYRPRPVYFDVHAVATYFEETEQ